MIGTFFIFIPLSHMRWRRWKIYIFIGGVNSGSFFFFKWDVRNTNIWYLYFSTEFGSNYFLNYEILVKRVEFCSFFFTSEMSKNFLLRSITSNKFSNHLYFKNILQQVHIIKPSKTIIENNLRYLRYYSHLCFIG